jgi:hypothetical protein
VKEASEGKIPFERETLAGLLERWLDHIEARGLCAGDLESSGPPGKYTLPDTGVLGRFCGSGQGSAGSRFSEITGLIVRRRGTIGACQRRTFLPSPSLL